ncbi:hypothetical protein AvCA_42380 [Azotobacter vinelandii CA]|uniref:Uncharacterized protein n=2 Tax=Azotobacter vinelandii TaxID=354 RepID=C1DFG6_AZOVD|nr:hypothetical protein [Azotobacter vinelandii]ACO80362.1 hypothetical protein Avin_42380 [Azotobacter vinelandii DJ]AGK14411.1 hypothetical protein AvCA_42380 [Azotobacter vinelandii CA]AGK21888.1 hypothetical protein AvCA6_42380 [Azotobacter vinelandii CA6]SFY27499.1 hypothetical protein SAMN04244547_04825 [Azotobacter vinelandii]GLK59530.1 hypothetical protein GCM10017624_16870 [Azotobacter vinelandii]
MNMRNRLEGFSAREDDQEDFDLEIAPSRAAAPARRRSGSLVLQIALGVWLGGLALMLTWYGLELLLPEAANLHLQLR